HEGENSDVLGDNDTAREGDTSDDMTDMQTKKGKGSSNHIESDEGGSVGNNSAFVLKGINENVEIKWNVQDILPEYKDLYNNFESDEGDYVWNNSEFVLKRIKENVKIK